MVLGHLAVADLSCRFVFRDARLLFLALAAYGPDFCDKTAKLFGGYGRGPGHSLLVFTILAAVAWLYCRKSAPRRRLFAAGAVMWLLHLVCDWPYVQVLGWPFAGELPPKNPWSMLDTAVMFYQGQFGIPMLACEVSLVLAALWLRLRDRFRAGAAVAVPARDRAQA